MQGDFVKVETTNENGEVSYILSGKLLTIDDELSVQLEPLVPEGSNCNSNHPAYEVFVLGRHGKYVRCGKGWLKEKGGNQRIGFQISEKRINATMFRDPENSDKWEIAA